MKITEPLAGAVLGAAITAPIALAPRLAHACGGTFCDNTALPMPVDQSGEDILFVQDGPEIEVHVRIAYEGDPERFAWLVPIRAVPEVSVGSEPLFDQLAAATAPVWGSNTSYECPSDEPWTGGFVPETDFAAVSEPEIVFESTVGAFEVVVLQGGTAAEVIEFLDANDYAQNPAAAPILQEYLDEGFLFAAIKLSAGEGSDSIHPLVFRLPAEEPCVPIRLTRIAAKQDMGIRAYFLGQSRWAPQNYEHVVLNPLAYPWSENATGDLAEYVELLSLAVDEAGGRAFATDYAGDSSQVVQDAIFSEAWDETVFVGLNMIEAIAAISQQGLAVHPLIQPLLAEFMPAPDGVDPQVFWNNIAEYADIVDIDDWDSAGFAAALAERVIEPGVHASELLETWPYLTRLHTTMSPHEMLVDPMFQPVPDLWPVFNRLDAQPLDLCGEAGTRYTVPFEGQSLPVCLAEWQNEWPKLLREHAALRIEQIPAVGPPQVIEEFEAAILASYQIHRMSQGCEADSPSETGDDGSSSAGTTGDTGDASPSIDAAKGCGCRTDDSTQTAGGWAASAIGLAALGLVRRRRRAG